MDNRLGFTSRRSSLVGRLIRLASAWFIVVLCLTGVSLTVYFYQTSLNRLDAGVRLIAYNLFVDTDIAPDGRVIPPELGEGRATHYHSGLYWQISEIDVQQRLINRESTTSYSAGTWRIPLPRAIIAEAKRRSGKTLFYNTRGPAGESLRVALIYSTIQRRPFVFLAGEDTRPMAHDARTFALVTSIALLVLAAGSLAAIYFQVRVGLRPLFDLTAELAKIQRGTQQRVAKTYPAEIQPVADQINAFLDYSQEVVERQRTHVGNLAHALKTPLSVLITSAGHAPGPLNEIVRRQAELMRGQVDHHLRRARAAARSNSTGERTLVEPVLDELAVTLEQVFREKGLTIEWRAPDRLAFRGERADLQEIVGNVMENACTWCKRRVHLVADFDESTLMLRLDIEDDGPGLPRERFGDVLKRGSRLDESVPGTGLGLSIVDELVRAYGGALDFSRSQLGGLHVHLRLPGIINDD